MPSPNSALLVCLFCAALAAAAAGCSDAPGPADTSGTPGAGERSTPADRLVGRWTGSHRPTDAKGRAQAAAHPEAFAAALALRRDGTLVMTYFGEPSPGTWELLSAEGDRLRLRTAVEMPSGGGFSIEETTGEGGTASTVRSESETQVERTEYVVTFETDDRLTLTPTDDSAMALVLERQP